MVQIRHQPLLFLIVLLLLPAIACQALNNLQEPQQTGLSEAEKQSIIAAAVATVEARSPDVQAANPSQPSESPITNTQLAVVDAGLQQKLIDVYERVNPAVVLIFIYNSVDETAIPLGSGSGFLHNEEGYIVTNNHVVADGDQFEVVFADGSREDAELVGTDVDSDLGVLKVASLPEGIQPIPLSNSKELVVGQFVIAIGNPFGEVGSMTIGIVSGLGRTLESQRIAEGGGRYSLPEVVQTDAAINPGNSGGPLLNLDGEVVGVNSAIQTLTGANSGVGFAIPVNAVKRIVPKLIEDGNYVYPFIGIRMVSLTLDLQEQLGLDRVTGAYVTDVTPGSPAEEAGLIGSPTSGGDLIVAINGQPVKTTDELISYLVFETEVDQTVDLTVVRNDEEIIIPLTLGERP